MPLLEKVTVTDIGAEGNAVARVDNLVVFVPMLIPGDVVDLRIVKRKKKYLEGKVVRFHEYSPDRIAPRCIHFRPVRAYTGAYTTVRKTWVTWYNSRPYSAPA